ncbi:MAG: hypothetical protein NT085_04395 [candidate division SR1 bacterium]|nr:hypothetical protein [candidate division SR1 bacterium]
MSDKDLEEKLRKAKQKTSSTTNLSSKMKKNLHEIIGQDDIIFSLGEAIYNQAKEKIENNQIEYVSEGMEGVVYKMEIELSNKEKKIFLAVKRRFDDKIKEEMKMQNDFYDVAKKSTTGTKVPNILGKIETTTGKYFLMEYIDGKTLFNLKIEKIAGYFYQKFKDKYPDFFQKLKGINKDIDRTNINKAHDFDFKNDAEAREEMLKITNFLNDQNEQIIQKYTGVKGVAYLEKKTYEATMKKMYYDQELYGDIFNQKAGWKLQQQIKDFLIECHEAKLFHRDLGGNPGNIMFMQGKDGIIPVIIDFGKSIKYEVGEIKNEYGRGDGPYGDEKETYIPDSDICEIIKTLTNKPPKKEPRELF